MATNLVSNSDFSNQGNGGVIITYPDPPQTLVNIPATTSATVIAFSWSPGFFDGGSAVIDSRVSWDQGTGIYTYLAFAVVGNSFATTVTLIPNTVYKFKLESRNAFGSS